MTFSGNEQLLTGDHCGECTFAKLVIQMCSHGLQRRRHIVGTSREVDVIERGERCVLEAGFQHHAQGRVRIRADANNHH